MRRRTVLVLGALAIAATTAWRMHRHAAHGPGVPMYTVKQTSFVRKVTADGNLRAVKATPLLTPQTEGMGGLKIAWIAAEGSRVKAGDVVVRFDPTDHERDLASGEADLAEANAKLAEERVKGTAAEKARDQDAVVAGKELDQTRHFQSKDEQIFSRNQIIESAIDAKLSAATEEHAEQAKAIGNRVAASDTALIGVEKQKAQLAIAHAKSALDSMEIKAPHDGIFVLERDWDGGVPKLGSQLWPGETVGEIPLLDDMEAELFVLEVDGSGLAEGQAADIVIEARPDVVYHGKIRLVDKLAKPRQHDVPVQYFSVVVKLDKTDPAVMKPGQRVHGTLVLDQERALVVPREAIVNKDGKNVVYRYGAAGFAPVPVELGAATAGLVVVTKGLAAGDGVALRDPPRALDARGSGAAAGAGSAAAPAAKEGK